MNAMDERARFEVFVIKEGIYDREEIDRAWQESGYSRAILSYMWDAWKARSAVSASGADKGTV